MIESIIRKEMRGENDGSPFPYECGSIRAYFRQNSMKLDADQVIQQIEKKDFPSQTRSTSKAALGRRFNQILQPGLEFIQSCLKKNQIGQVNWKIGTRTVMSLEINVINMPYSSLRPLKRLVSGNGAMPAHVYVMISQPKLNRSGFRIDWVDSADQFVTAPTDELPKLRHWLTVQYQQMKKYRAELAKAPKKTTRRSRRRGTRRKRRK